MPITTLDRLLASLTASTLGGQLDRMAVNASLHCPECGRRGHWECEAPGGTRKAVQRARGWRLWAAADADGMEVGTPTGGGNRAEEVRPAQCVAGTEPVWVCGEPWGQRKHWTRQPLAVLREGGDPDHGGMHVHPGGGDTGRVERDFVSFCDEMAMERRRGDVTRWQEENSRRSRPARPSHLTSLTSPSPSTSPAVRVT